MELWACYSKQEKMVEAQRAYTKVIQAGVTHALLVESAKHWSLAKGHLMENAESQLFFPYLHNWLRNKSYLDRPAIPRSKGEPRSADAPPREQKAAGSSKPTGRKKKRAGSKRGRR